MYAWLAIENVHLQSRIVGDCRKAGVSGGGPGLDDGILDETQAGLGHLGHVELGLGEQFHPDRREDVVQFPQFPRITAGQHNLFALGVCHQLM